jgi:hypothetical protein
MMMAGNQTVARARNARLADGNSIEEAAVQQNEKADKCLKLLALPRGIEPLFQP